MLVDFRRVFIPAGEKRTVCFTVEERYFQYYDAEEKGYRTFTGPRDVLVGASSRDIRLRAAVDVT